MTPVPQALYDDIVACGYFPDLVADSLAMSLAGEPLISHLVHHEATFNHDVISRHLTVLALTPTRLLVGHTDEAEPQETGVRELRAASTVESVRVDRINVVALTRVVSSPDQWATSKQRPDAVAETWLTVGWGIVRRVDLEPAACGDPDCVADHGLTGQLVADDLTVRVSHTADGPERVQQLIDFGSALQAASGGLHR